MEVSSVTGRPPLQEYGAYRDVAKLARVFIDAHFRGPVCMVDLCGATGAGVRTVQRRFRQRFGVTVSNYLKAVRLDAAYRDLIASHPSRDTVTAIALRNGWRHPGRFSCEFRERFGQRPRETLRSEPSRSGSAHCNAIVVDRPEIFISPNSKCKGARENNNNDDGTASRIQATGRLKF